MVMLCKTGAVSIPKVSSPATSANSSPDNSPFHNHNNNSPLSFRLLRVDEVEGNSFFAAGVALDDDSVVFFYQLEHADGVVHARPPVSDRAFVTNSTLYVEAKRPVTQLNKESLSSLLDLADDAGCTVVHACVSKDDAALNDIVRSYAACGFALVPSGRLDNFVVMKFAI